MIGENEFTDANRIKGIDSVYGREISCSKTDNVVSILYSILPTEDIVITKEIHLELIFPTDYHLSGGIKVKTKSVQLFTSVGSDFCDTNELSLSWLSEAKYDFRVWYFSARNMLIKTNRIPWITPFEIRTKFPLCCVRHGRSNTQDVNMMTGSGRTRGRRSYMEDIDFDFDSIRVSDRQFVAVFGVLDGHGGKECAQFASDEIPSKLASLLRSGKSCDEALYRSFLETDKEFLRSGRSTAGCTASVMLWDRRSCTAYLANTGDTRAVLSRSGRAIDITRDKKATDPDEIARIAKEGGFVVKGRVMGSLAVARALGDAQLKDSSNRILIADPEVTMFRPNAHAEDYGEVDRDEFIVIATDGLWDVMTSQEAVTMVREAMLKAGILDDSSLPAPATIKAELNRIGDNIASHAVKVLGSLDNVTVMIIKVCIKNPHVPMQMDEAEPAQEFSSEEMTSFQNGATVPDSSTSSGYAEDRNKSQRTSSSSESKLLGKDRDSKAYDSNAPVEDDDSFADILGGDDAAAGGVLDGSRFSGVGSSGGEAKIQQQPAAGGQRTVATPLIARAPGTSDAKAPVVPLTPGSKLAKDDEDMLEFLLDDSNF